VSLSEDLRNELASIAPRRGCDRLAELSGLFHSAGSLHLRGRGEVAVHLDLASSAVARRAFALLREFRIRAEIRTYSRRAFGRETRYQVHVDGKARALQVLNEAGVVSAGLAPLERPPKRVVARPCCASAYLRGALLGSGSLSGPGSPHLEVRAASRVGAELIASLSGAAGAKMAVHERGRHAVAYAKGVDAIAGAIAAAGASDTALAFQERAVVGATKARANRLANADHANLVRTSRAAKAQIRAIRKLERRRQLADLPRPLREIARLRVRHPALSLRELGRRCSPPATKSSAQRRLAKLVRIAGL
jgi:cell division protein WhiA